MLEKITQALATAYKRDHEGVGDNIAVIADEERNIVRMVHPPGMWWRCG